MEILWFDWIIYIIVICSLLFLFHVPLCSVFAFCVQCSMRFGECNSILFIEYWELKSCHKCTYIQFWNCIKAEIKNQKRNGATTTTKKKIRNRKSQWEFILNQFSQSKQKRCHDPNVVCYVNEENFRRYYLDTCTVYSELLDHTSIHP